jgi:hypothetical protein
MKRKQLDLDNLDIKHMNQNLVLIDAEDEIVISYQVHHGDAQRDQWTWNQGTIRWQRKLYYA